MLFLLTALTLVTAPVQDTAHLVLVATTDVHGHATDWDYVAGRPFPGGLTRVATIVDSLRSRYPGQVVVMDAGDMIQGDPFATYFARVSPRAPNPVIEAMNLTGYDVATPGNHDFDWGVATLRQTVAGAAFPYVSGNIYTLPADTLLYPPFVVLQRQGVRIGIAGLTTPGVMLWNGDKLRDRIRVERIPAAAARVTETLRRVADLSVILVHSGMSGPASYDTTGVGGENVAASLATLPAPPALVIVGHSHGEMREAVLGGVHFTQPKPYGGSVSITHVDLVRERNRWQITRMQSELVSTATIIPSPRLTQRLAPAHALVLAWAGTEVGRAAAPMRAAAARAEPTPIINFINAVQRKRSGADLSATPAFDLRAGFDSGSIRMADLLALYPFDNTLRAVRITGSRLKEYLEQSARYFRTDAINRISINDSVPGYNYDVVAGARYDIDLRRPVGDRIRNLEVRGRAVRPTDSLTLAVNSYRQTGAGGYSMLRDAPVVYDKGENIRDLLVEEIRSRGSIDPADYADRSWRIVPEGSALAVRGLFRVPARPVAQSPRDTIVLRILATSDLHGALLPKVRESTGDRPAGGVAAIAGMMDSLAADCQCPTLRLDAGDAMQGTVISNLTKGRSMVEVLNRLGVAAAALGEHDLDWSLDTLRRRMSEARFPWLAANVFDSAVGGRPEWISPYRMVQIGGLRVAVVGYITSDTKSNLKAELTPGLRFGDGELAIHDVLAQVRAQHPDLTVLLAHAGAACEGAVCTGEVIRLAEGVQPRTLDLIVAGHSHNVVNTRVAGVSIVEPGSGGAALAVADVIKTSAGGQEVRTRIEPVFPQQVTEDSAMAAVVEGYRRKADSLAGRVVATIKFPLYRADQEYRLASLIAEARRNVLRADLGLVRSDDIRADLPGGPVSYGQLFEVQSSQNGLVKVTLSGRELREMLEHSFDRRGQPTAQVSGALVHYDPRRPARKRVKDVEFRGGRKLQPDATYTLAVDDFLAAGGEGYTMLMGRPAEPAALLDVDGLITYLKRLPQPVEVTGVTGFISTRR
ncbi:MAG TPA: 5'-nucleotidase C-terminal domain-containing protein [Gemmatimonadales bacterium]|nr:5'-nucleotidase C-terminal domain-containing protein [Gemmatimonadales bacterium]